MFALNISKRLNWLECHKSSRTLDSKLPCLATKRPLPVLLVLLLRTCSLSGDNVDNFSQVSSSKNSFH